MNFQRFQDLARSVFPQHSAAIDSMEDNARTYHALLAWCCPADSFSYAALSDMERVNMFSLKNMCETQIRHWRMLDKSVWKKS